MAQEAKRFVTPVGRVIWGSLSELNTNNSDGKPEPDVSKHHYSFGLAILKNAPGLQELFGMFYQQAIAGYPNNPAMAQRIGNEWQSGFAGNQGGFKFKIKDGDRNEIKSGKPNPNAVGHYVIAFKSNFPIKCANTQNQEIDAKQVERGYFVDVAGSTLVNEKLDHTAGLYMNPNVVRLIAFGEKIMGGISIEDAFAGHAAPTQLPPGASATPVAPAGGMPGFTPQGQALPGMPPQGGGAIMPGGPGTAQPMAPGGYAQPQGAPAMGYPSNPAPLPGMPPQGGAGFTPPQNGNGGYQTGYPINQQTGQPFAPHTGFAAGPGAMPGS